MNKSYWFVVIGAILYGTVIFGGQFFVTLGFSAFEITIYRLLLELLAFLPIVVWSPKYLITKKMIPFFVVFGLINSIQELSQYQALIYGVPVAIVALLLYSQPIWSTLFGKLLLNENFTRIKVAAVVVAFLGIVVLLRPWDLGSIGSFAGIVYALVSGIFLSLWVVYSRKSGVKGHHWITTAFGCILFTFLWLLLLWPLVSATFNRADLLRMPNTFGITTWLFLLAFAFVSGIIPQSFFYKGVQKVEAGIAGVILLLEPVSASILSAMFFSQALGWNILAGGTLILFSNYLVLKK